MVYGDDANVTLETHSNEFVHPRLAFVRLFPSDWDRGLLQFFFPDTVSRTPAPIAVAAWPLESQITGDFIQHLESRRPLLHGKRGDEQVVAEQINQPRDASRPNVDLVHDIEREH